MKTTPRGLFLPAGLFRAHPQILVLLSHLPDINFWHRLLTSYAIALSMRKLPSQVPDAVSRLLKSTLIISPPVWYAPALANPPPLLPARRSRARPALDEAREHYLARYDPSAIDPLASARAPRHRPQEIVYEADEIRTQFFRDFPFEALRPTSLLEGRDVPPEAEISGPEWTSLEQRGLYASVEE